MTSQILVWYRNDLRLQDHEPLNQALQQQATVLPVYCFDPRQFGTTSFGFPKTGIFRAQFLLECVANLRQSLQSVNSNLIVRLGLPEQVLPQLVEQFQISAVYYHQEVASEEITVEAHLRHRLNSLGIPLKSFWGHTLYHIEDLPFHHSQTPELFTTFRKQIEQQGQVRPVLPAPQQLPTLPPEISPGEIPTLSDLRLAETAPTQLRFRGGEQQGQQRLQHYFWQQNRLRTYKETRNSLMGEDNSSKFSPWLATGCLSPRYIYQQVLQYETERIRNDSTYWLGFELLWRDYFRLISLKHGSRLFLRTGIQGLPFPWKQDWPSFELWRLGQTGYPLVDASMRELAATGFMSNRGRQNVASFLTKNLGLDWRLGAEWFESLLIDYDVCSNWGNWNYAAGIGNDARGFRCFNITKQAKDYDPTGEYIKQWLPELSLVPIQKIHEPWTLSAQEQTQYGVRIGTTYPTPMVELLNSAQANEKLYKIALQQL